MKEKERTDINHKHIIRRGKCISGSCFCITIVYGSINMVVVEGLDDPHLIINICMAKIMTAATELLTISLLNELHLEKKRGSQPLTNTVDGHILLDLVWVY